MTDERKIIRTGKMVRSQEHGCFVCGQLNEIGLKLQFDYDFENNTATATIIFGNNHQGWDNVVHGGILAAALDDAMAHSIYTTDNLGITTRMNLTYRKPVKVGEKISLEGRVVRMSSKLADASAIAFSIDETTGERIIRCEATGTYYLDPAVKE